MLKEIELGELKTAWGFGIVRKVNEKGAVVPGIVFRREVGEMVPVKSMSLNELREESRDEETYIFWMNSPTAYIAITTMLLSIDVDMIAEHSSDMLARIEKLTAEEMGATSTKH